MASIWRVLRAVFRMGRVVFFLLRLSVQMRLGFVHLTHEAQQRRIRAWSAELLRCLGVSLTVVGQVRPGAKLVVGNHISWMDIMAINAVEPSRFVSKAEVGRWPVVGPIVTLAGTIYLERARRRDAMRVMGLLTQTLKDGHVAAVFPEGTTADGRALLPFHGNLLQSAIDADVPVQPLALRYSDPVHAVSPAVAFVGDTTLLQSLWSVLCADRLRVTVTVLPALRVTHSDRRALADRLREEIDQALQMDEA